MIKKCSPWLLCGVMLFTSSFLFGQKQKKIVSSQAQPVLIDQRFSFTEGPAADHNGKIYFTDQPNDRIYVWEEAKGISLYLEGTGRSNGMFFSRDGQLIACADEKNQLVSFDANKQMTVLVEDYKGKPLNAPNDLWIAPDGGIYFTDPYYHRSWWPEGRKEEQDTRGVYFWKKGSALLRVVDDLKTPNGIIGTPDGKYVYVADIEAGKTWRYLRRANGELYGKTLFAPRGSDGMTIDEQGNVYLTSGKVWVYNPEGHLIKAIDCPEKPSNVCFGGRKGNRLFITARTGVYMLKMKVNGVERPQGTAN